MIDEHLLEILVCPENHARLHPAEGQLIGKVNRLAAAGTLRNRAGQRVESTCDGGPIREDGALLYPIVDGIAGLLIDEAILLEQVD